MKKIVRRLKFSVVVLASAANEKALKDGVRSYLDMGNNSVCGGGENGCFNLEEIRKRISLK